MSNTSYERQLVEKFKDIMRGDNSFGIDGKVNFGKNNKKRKKCRL